MSVLKDILPNGTIRKYQGRKLRIIGDAGKCSLNGQQQYFCLWVDPGKSFGFMFTAEERWLKEEL